MYSWRITKYNPKYRDENDTYNKNEWTSYYDIGKAFDGVIFNLSDYEKAESAYADTIQSFMRRLGITSLTVKNLEKYQDSLEAISKNAEESIEMINLYENIKEGFALDGTEIESACKLILRELLWCKFENDNSLFVHFGYDYYMYICSNEDCSDIFNNIAEKGLYVEKMESPYLKEADE